MLWTISNISSAACTGRRLSSPPHVTAHITRVHYDPWFVVLHINVTCYHGAWESVLNVCFIYNNCSTTHGAGVKSLQTAGVLKLPLNKDNTWPHGVQTSVFPLGLTPRGGTAREQCHALSPPLLTMKPRLPKTRSPLPNRNFGKIHNRLQEG